MPEPQTAAPTASWTVQGEHRTEDGWTPFEANYSAASKADARWQARRDYAGGSQVTRLEALPPNPERERVEIAAATREDAARLERDEGVRVPFVSDRVEARSAEQASEYARLTQTVRITAVERTS